MSLGKRLRALEQAGKGGAEPIELWSQDETEPDMFTLHLTGERLTRAEVEARRGVQVILVLYGERP